MNIVALYTWLAILKGFLNLSFQYWRTSTRSFTFYFDVFSSSFNSLFANDYGKLLKEKLTNFTNLNIPYKSFYLYDFFISSLFHSLIAMFSFTTLSLTHTCVFIDTFLYIYVCLCLSETMNQQVCCYVYVHS